MNYYLLNPENVHVFPFGKTRNTDTNARVFNEQNITNLVRMLTDKKSYVVSFDSDSKIMEFVLNGYYFKTNLNSIWSELFNESDPSDIYASIQLHEVDKYSYLLGGDTIYNSARGTGTYQDPYILSRGHFESSIKRADSTNDNDTYYSYTFEESGDILIQDNDNIIISVLNDFPSTVFETESGKFVKITGNTDETVMICISLNLNAPTGLVAIDVLHSSKFDGVVFTKFDPETPHKLHILTPSENSLNVPKESYLKFDEKSLNIDYIYCGDASNLV